MTFSKWAEPHIYHTTMGRNPINGLYNPGHMILWCLEVGLVANAREGSTQEHDWARMYTQALKMIHFACCACVVMGNTRILL